MKELRLQALSSLEKRCKRKYAQIDKLWVTQTASLGEVSESTPAVGSRHEAFFTHAPGYIFKACGHMQQVVACLMGSFIVSKYKLLALKDADACTRTTACGLIILVSITSTILF